MGLVTMDILDANGATKTVVLDDVSDDLYPVYKMSTGLAGSVGNLVTPETPLPASDPGEMLYLILDELRAIRFHLAILTEAE